MYVILLGPQGSGKGTQANLLSDKYNLEHLEMGRIFRSIASSDHPMATKVAELINSGQLAPDELTSKIAEDFIVKHHPERRGFVFEGYPRSLGQYQLVKNTLAAYGKPVSLVVNIEISTQETILRLSNRRTCVTCGRVYNLQTQSPNKAGVCDVCGGVLTQRDDDKPEAINRRLVLYRQITHPVFEQALKEGVGVELNGERPIETIFGEIVQIIEERGIDKNG